VALKPGNPASAAGMKTDGTHYWAAFRPKVVRLTRRILNPDWHRSGRLEYATASRRRTETRFYACVARLVATRARSPVSAERTAWISAKHPSTFRGRFPRFPSHRDDASLVNFRLLVAPVWRRTCESVLCVEFCSTDISLAFFYFGNLRSKIL
jgi:hypothetical protein